VNRKNRAKLRTCTANRRTNRSRVGGVGEERGRHDPSAFQCRNSRGKTLFVSANERDGKAFRAKFLSDGGPVSRPKSDDHDGF
jgi:hypothetical protein